VDPVAGDELGDTVVGVLVGDGKEQIWVISQRVMSAHICFGHCVGYELFLLDRSLSIKKLRSELPFPRMKRAICKISGYEPLKIRKGSSSE
jgi:hypothetical protein